MRRILYVSTSTTLGGAEKTLYTLATLVDPRVCRVAGVVSIKEKGHYAQRLEEAGTPVFSLEARARAGLRDLQRLAVIVHETKPDVVHAIMYQAIQLCRAVKRLGYADFKLVSSPRVNYRSRDGLSLILDGFLKKADDLLIAECEASRKYLVERLGYPEARTIAIHNGVDIAGWTISQSDRARCRGELKLEDKDVLIGAIGRLDYQKGHAFLLEAVARLRVAHPVKLVLLGDGPLRDYLAGLAAKLGLEGHVFMLGERPDAAAWLSALDIFAMPSLWEGLPNALLEAMALGLPVVATRVDGVPEAVAHDMSGILCQPKDSQALFVPLQDLIVDPALRRRLGEGARTVITENFTLAKMIERYEAAYRKVLGEEA